MLTIICSTHAAFNAESIELVSSQSGIIAKIKTKDEAAYLVSVVCRTKNTSFDIEAEELIIPFNVITKIAHGNE